MSIIGIVEIDQYHVAPHERACPWRYTASHEFDYP